MGKCVYKNCFGPQEKPQPILVILMFFRFWREFCGTISKKETTNFFQGFTPGRDQYLCLRS